MNLQLTELSNWWIEFLHWVEQTNLFRLIKDNPNADRIEGVSQGAYISLQRINGLDIQKASDLPFPLLLEFLRNYPNIKNPRPFLNDDELKKKVLGLMVSDGLKIEHVIDVIIELNGIIGVGLISLGGQLNDYCKSKI